MSNSFQPWYVLLLITSSWLRPSWGSACQDRTHRQPNSPLWLHGVRCVCVDCGDVTDLQDTHHLVDREFTGFSGGQYRDHGLIFTGGLSDGKLQHKHTRRNERTGWTGGEEGERGSHSSANLKIIRLSEGLTSSTNHILPLIVHQFHMGMVINQSRSGICLSTVTWH